MNSPTQALRNRTNVTAIASSALQTPSVFLADQPIAGESVRTCRHLPCRCGTHEACEPVIWFRSADATRRWVAVCSPCYRLGIENVRLVYSYRWNGEGSVIEPLHEPRAASA